MIGPRHTHSRMYVHGIDAPQKNKKNKTPIHGIFSDKAVWVTPGSGDGRAEKSRYDVPQGVGVKKRYEAELTNQRHGSGSKT